MKLPVVSYAEQTNQWPQSGRHILAQFDDDTIVVYQAYRPGIGQWAAKHGRFGGDFSYRRMSWIKPNFLWMMYRCDWGRSEGQQTILAIRLRREFFDSLLRDAVYSSFQPGRYVDESQWQAAVNSSNVRLQWDPDHRPTGEKCERRAVQLGMRGPALEAYGQKESIEIIDISDFVAEQRELASRWRDGRLLTPVESVYRPTCEVAVQNVAIDETP